MVLEVPPNPPEITDPTQRRGGRFYSQTVCLVGNVSGLTRGEASLSGNTRAQQLEALNAQLRRLTSRLMTPQDEERRRIARNLHDSLGLELAAAKMSIDAVVLQDQAINLTTKMAATEASAMIDRAIQQVPSVSHLLHPPLLNEVGLLSALRWLLEGLTKRSGIETFLDVHPANFPDLRLSWKQQSSESFRRLLTMCSVIHALKTAGSP